VETITPALLRATHGQRGTHFEQRPLHLVDGVETENHHKLIVISERVDSTFHPSVVRAAGGRAGRLRLHRDAHHTMTLIAVAMTILIRASCL